MECTVVRAAQGRRPRRRRVRLLPRARPVRRLPGQGGRAGDRRHRQGVQDHQQQLGIHRRRPHARLRRRRRAAGHGVRPVPSDGDDLAAERAGHPGDRRRARRGRRPAQQQGRAASCSTTSPRTTHQTAKNPEEGWRYCQGDKNAHRPARAADARPRRPLHPARGQRGPRQPARRRLPRHLLDQGEDRPTRAEHIKQEAAQHVPPVQGAGRHRHHEGADGGRPDDALHHGRRARGCRHADVDACRGCSLRRVRGRASTAPTGWAATRCRTCSCSASGPASSRPSTRKRTRRRQRSTPTRSRRRRERRWSRSSGGGGEGPYQIQHDLQEMMQDLVGIVRREEEMQRALEGLAAPARAGGAASTVTGNREYNPGWHTALDLHNLLTVSEAITRAALVRKESRGGHFRDDYPDKDAGIRQGQHRGAQGRRRRRCSVAQATPIPEMPRRSCKQIIEEMQVSVGLSRRLTGTRSCRCNACASGAATRSGGKFHGLHDRRSPRAWSSSTPSTRSRPSRPTTSPCAGTARRQVRLVLGRDQRQAAARCA